MNKKNITLGEIKRYPKLNKCEYTVTGDHMFMPKKIISNNLKKCIACGLIDDRK